MPHAEAIALVYELALDRDPSPAEIEHWSLSIGGGLPFEDFLIEVAGGEEARAVELRDSSTLKVDAAAAIGSVYQHALGRSPSAEEGAHWASALGRSLSFSDFMSEVATSEEAQAFTRRRTGQGDRRPDARIDDAALRTAIDAIYERALGRVPSPQEAEHWSASMHQGLAFADFVSEVTASEEAWAFQQRRDVFPLRPPHVPDRHADEETTRTAIAFVYRAALRREATAEDVTHWTRHLAAGLPFEAFLLELLSSEEARLLPQAAPDEPSEDAIAFVYRSALRRDATREDIAKWTRHLHAGLPFQRFVLDLVGSEEARLLPQADPDEPSEDAIAFVYRAALRRDATREDIAKWTRDLAAGLPFQRFVLDLLGSEEARLLPQADPGEPSEDAIAFVYRAALRREATREDIAKWTRDLAAGMPFQRFVLDLLASEEARLLPQADPGEPSEDAIAFVYRSALRREPTPEDVATWSRHLRAGMPFQQFVLDIAGSEEAAQQTSSSRIAEELPDGLFIAHLYEFFLNRCALAGEILEWKRRLARQSYPRAELLLSFFGSAVRDERERREAAWRHDPTSITIMGTDRRLDAEVWRRRAAALASGTETPFPPAPMSAPYVVRPNTVTVTAIASLYKGGQYIEKFLANIMAQSLGENFELVIIDANSPDNEYDVIRKYASRFPNIRYERMNYRIGIYDAWNVAVDIARGEYLTNTNLDDLRRRDSLQIQAEALDRVALADVVYQDFFYSFDADMSFAEVEALGFVSAVPIVTRNNILEHNSPHNAPMWRKRLHKDVGLFDTSLKSAGDHDLWLRCMQAGKIFYKINTPHVVYFQNPTGVSTRPGTPGVDEGMRILKKHGRTLVSPFVYMDPARFSAELGATGGIASVEADPLYPETAVKREILALLATEGVPGESRP